jgi:hypothetical protein
MLICKASHMMYQQPAGVSSASLSLGSINMPWPPPPTPHLTLSSNTHAYFARLNGPTHGLFASNLTCPPRIEAHVTLHATNAHACAWGPIMRCTSSKLIAPLHVSRVWHTCVEAQIQCTVSKSAAHAGYKRTCMAVW